MGHEEGRDALLLHGLGIPLQPAPGLKALQNVPLCQQVHLLHPSNTFCAYTLSAIPSCYYVSHPSSLYPRLAFTLAVTITLAFTLAKRMVAEEGEMLSGISTGTGCDDTRGTNNDCTERCEAYWPFITEI